MFSVNIRAKSSCDILKSVGISRGIGIFSAQYGLKVGGRTSVEACCCDACRMILISYGEEAAKI